MAHEITRDVVEGLTDVEEAMGLMDQHHIPYDHLKTLEEFKERCICHWKKIRYGSVRDNIEESMIRAGEDDKSERQMLLRFFRDLENILKLDGYNGYSTDKIPFYKLDRLLEEDGTSEHLANDFQSRKENLEKGDCRILVAGETNAGKSSCLNLVLGEVLLDESPHSSTSVIANVSHGEVFSARVHHNNGIQDDINRQELTDIVSCKLQHDISDVQIRLKSKILQNTMALLDSPGIGENEFLEDMLIKYINDHEIHGFIYTVKTDNAGGVQEDMLLNLLRIVMKQQSEKQNGKITSRFDPRAAIFLCNRFDNVEASERDKVKSHILRQLGKIWPGLSESQVIFFSCKNAKRDLEVDPEYVSDSFQTYLEGLRDLYIYVMDKRIRENYKWIETVLQRSQYHLRTVVYRLGLSESDLREKLKETQEKLKALEKKSGSVISKLRQDFEILTQNICKQLEVYLKTPTVRTQLVERWTIDELPKASLGSWACVKARVEDAFYIRLGKLLDGWKHDNKTIKEHEKEMIITIQTELNLLQSDIEEIEGKLDDSGLGRSIPEQTSSDDENPSLKLFRSLPLKQTFSKDYINKYKKRQEKYAQHRSKKLLSWLLEGKKKGKMQLSTLIKKLLASPESLLQNLERNLPDFILTTTSEIQRFQKCEKMERQHQSEYQRLLDSFEEMESSLTEYGERYVFMDDFRRYEIKVEELAKDDKIFKGLKHIKKVEAKAKLHTPHGLWTGYRDGFLWKSDHITPITIRVYLPSAGMAHAFHEVTKLRTLNVEHHYLAECIGIHQTNTPPTSAFIYEGRYQSLRQYLTFLDTGHNKSYTINVQRMDILLNVARALDYLENRKLVHMELTRDTVTVTNTGEVRLTGACLPRKATFQPEMESISVDNFCYLAPEVLKGDSYTSAADMYSFGLLFPEVLISNFSVFETQRTWALDTFVKHKNLASIVLEELKEFPIDLDLIMACLNKDKTHRPSAMRILEHFC
ncbi:hypothetical protein ACJMK2_017072 [Sinanodonta woodiana]|uniref:Protein kinase domain-containing protein n=1 Tax=Sinanodonta woodiana TaxID=1069815 RepID=A0ABD3UZ45_SINWO